MALRSLHAEINLRDHASAGLKGIDDSIDGIRDGFVGTQDEVSALSDETSEFGYSASRDIEGVAGSTSELEHTTRGFGDRMRSVGDTVSRNWTAITAAVGVAAVAMEGFARQQQDMIESSDRLAYSTNLQSEEVRNLAVDMSNATFSLEDAYELMELGTKQGMESQEQLREYAELWDMVGDATRENAVELARSSVALRALGIEAGGESDALAAFGFITQNTTGTVSDFLTFIERTGPELRDMGMDINDAAAVTGALERELGMTARMARQEFRKAVNDSDGEMGAFLDTLGLTESQMQEYRGQVEQSGPVIQDLADMYADNRTAAQELQATMEGLMHLYGAEFMPIIDMATPLVMGLATVMGIAAAGQYLAAGAAGVATKALFGLTIGILGVTAPLWLVVGAVVAVGAAFWYFWDDVVALGQEMANMGEWMYDAGVSVVEGFVGGIISCYDWIKDAVTGIADTVTGGIKDIFGIKSPSALMWEFGVNMGEGLNLGLEEESKGFFSDARRMFSPEREPAAAMGGAGAYAPTVNITVNGAGRDADGIAGTIDRRLRQTFSTHAERYFSRQRRKR